MLNNTGPNSIIHIFKIYFTDRFPTLPLFAYTTVSAFAINTIGKEMIYIKVFAVSVIFLLFLIHLRIMDDFKDLNYDNLNHVDRPVQQGLVSLPLLKVLGTTNLILLLIIGYLASNPLILSFLIFSLSYTFFMYKEFFIPEFLRKRIFLYLFSHEIVLIPLFLFFYSLLAEKVWKPVNIFQLSHFIYLILPMVIIEVGRKMKHRLDRFGKPTDDTYAYVLGEKVSLQLFIALLLLEVFLSLRIPAYNTLSSLFIFTFTLTLFISSIRWHQALIKNNVAITTFTGLLIPALLLI